MTESGNGLSRKPAAAIAALLFLYVITGILADLAALSLGAGSAGTVLVSRILFFGLFTFVFVPRVLGLPLGKRTARSFLEDVGLAAVHPPGRLLLVTLSCYAIFAASQLVGAWFYHREVGGALVVDFSRNTLTAPGSLVAGVFEEIVMRGMIVTLLWQFWSRHKSILVSAVLFAGLHLLNLLNPGANPSWVLAQVVWAFALGKMYAYLFTEVRSLFPVIFLHYAINAFAGVWFAQLSQQNLDSAAYGIPFFGVVPAVLAILWIRFLSSRWGGKRNRPNE